MREELIKSMIKYKLTMASKLLDKLPPEASSRVKTFGKLAYDAISEFETPAEQAPAAKTDSINIE
jgi:hypothetical protein